MPVSDFDFFPRLPDPPGMWDDEDEDDPDPQPIEARAWAGPLDGQVIRSASPRRLYAVRGPGRLVTLIDGDGELSRYELHRVRDDGSPCFHRAVAGFYLLDGAASRSPRRWRYTDFEAGRRPPRDYALDWIERLPRDGD